MSEIEYGVYVNLQDETDTNNNVIKVRGMMVHPDIDGKKRGICERITYDKDGKAIAWEYPKFVDKQIINNNSAYVLIPVAPAGK